MSIRISIFTTITNPTENQYAWEEALNNYLSFADEVIVVDGESNDGTKQDILIYQGMREKLKVIFSHWPQDKWDWSELPKHINLGFEQCTGDVAIKMDIDYLIHEKDFEYLRKRLELLVKNKFVLGSFIKFNVVNRELGYQKVEVANVVNMKFKKQIAFGRNMDKETDWCMPIYKKHLSETGVWEGRMVPDTHKLLLGPDLYNYDYFFRTKEKAREIFWRFAKAYASRFDESWGSTEESSWQVFLKMMFARVQSQALRHVDHPKVIKDKVFHMTSNQFGFDNWEGFKGLITTNSK